MLDHHRCVDCGRRATQVDHVIPVVMGGNDEIDNLRSQCERCHRRRHADLWLGAVVSEAPLPSAATRGEGGHE
jgi:5-methylcytosine-specific restriction endonuclease McrA